MIKNLPFDATEEDIRNLFSHLKIKQIHLARGKKSGKSKGFAFVEFDHHQDFIKALHVRNPMLNSRKLEIIKSDRGISTSK